MITAASHSIKIIRRSSFDFSVKFEISHGVPMSLVGLTLISQLWDRNRLVKHTDFTVQIISAIEGIVQFSLSADETATLPTTGVYDVKAIGNSKEYYYIKGSFTTEEGYTDD